jgi:hypothetical protein
LAAISDCQLDIVLENQSALKLCEGWIWHVSFIPALELNLVLVVVEGVEFFESVPGLRGLFAIERGSFNKRCPRPILRADEKQVGWEHLLFSDQA